MENQPSFELNLAIQRWRENLGQSPAFRHENLDELEAHLRDSVATLQTRGLSAQEAFGIATGRIGGGGVLGTEFAKVNASKVWLDRLLWMLIGIQVWGLVAGFIGSISTGALSLGLLRSNFDFANHSRAIPIVLFTLVRLFGLAASLALCWWLIVRKGDALGSCVARFLHLRKTLVVICGALCLISLVSWELDYGWTLLLIKFTDAQTFGELAHSKGYANMFIWLVQTVTLLAITLLIARQRLRTKSA